MARFPKAEAEIVALADAMVSGLAANATIYPAPPVASVDLTILVSAYTTSKNAAIAAQAAAEEATTNKDETLYDMVDAMKSDIRYAENTAMVVL